MAQGIALLRRAGLSPREGLPQELFLLISALTPIPNVDLWLQNQQGQVLLAWRDDPFFGKGWHIPGGCIRFGETMAQRIEKTARQELGCPVTFDPTPMAVRDIIRPPVEGLDLPDMRGHHVAVLYRCALPEGFVLRNRVSAGENGYLQWFSAIPTNFLPIHEPYRDVIEQNIAYERGEHHEALEQ